VHHSYIRAVPPAGAPRNDRERLRGRTHRAAAGEAEINFRRVRMAVIGAHLARLPARHGKIARADLTQDLLNVAR